MLGNAIKLMYERKGKVGGGQIKVGELRGRDLGAKIYNTYKKHSIRGIKWENEAQQA